MRLLGGVLLRPAACLVWLCAMAPFLAAIVLGQPQIGGMMGEPWFAASLLRSLRLAEVAVGLGLPVGAAAAIAVWRSGRARRRLVLGGAVLVLVVPPSLAAEGLGWAASRAGLPGAQAAVLLLAHVAPAACIVLLVLTGFLNAIDPVVMQSAALGGASPVRRTVFVLLPNLAWPAMTAAAAAWALSLGEAALDARLMAADHPTLAGLLAGAAQHGDAWLAPGVLALSAAALLPLLLLGLARTMKRG